MTLAEFRLKAGKYAEVTVPFPARLRTIDADLGRPIVVTAVLERTAVYHCGDEYDRKLARLGMVELNYEPEVYLTSEAALKEQSSAARGRRASAAKRKVA